MGGFGPPFLFSGRECNKAATCESNDAMTATHYAVRSLAIAIALMAVAGSMTRANAQPILPALLNATSVDAAITAVGAGKPVFNGRLSLDFADIALPGPLRISARSDMPGTVAMVLLAGAPAGWYGSGVAGSRPPPPPPAAGRTPKPALIKAWQVPAGQAPRFTVTYDGLTQRQAFTLLASSQGRWYIAVREAKLACPPGACLPYPAASR